MRLALAALACVSACASIDAHDLITTNLTYSRDVSRILLRRCASCHGENASIPLTKYAEVRPWAVGIKEQVLSRNMPPWGAVKGFGDLDPDGALTQEEILILAAWAIGGAPQGDPDLLPKTVSEASRSLVAPSQFPVDSRITLSKPLVVYGVAPTVQEKVSSVKITAREPDSSIEPLVWLYEYDPKFDHAFLFRHSVTFPAGTVIETSAPLRFALLTDSKVR